MKRIVLGVLAAGIILTVGATTAFAAGMHGSRASGANAGICLSGSTCSVYVDADGDGICDNCTSDHGACLNNGSYGNYADADGDGVCDNRGAHCGDSAAWSGTGHHGGCQGECRGSLCGANRR